MNAAGVKIYRTDLSGGDIQFVVSGDKISVSVMNDMKVTIDRFEGIFAVCEKADRTMINIPTEKIQPKLKKGIF